MAADDSVMVIDERHFTVKLHRGLLEVDLKKGVRKELEDAVEAKPALRGSVGFLFQSMLPLDVPVRDIDSAECNEAGRVRIRIPYRKDVVIQLEPVEAKKLVDKLNLLISAEKEAETERRRRRAIMDDR